MFIDDREIIEIEPLNPVVKGHRIVIPKAHVQDFSENVAVTSSVMEYAATLAKTLGDVNLITSKGKNATQSVFHLHVHLIPRTKDDGLHLPWTNQAEAPQDVMKEFGWLEDGLRGLMNKGWEAGKKQAETPNKYTLDTDEAEPLFLKIKSFLSQKIAEAREEELKRWFVSWDTASGGKHWAVHIGRKNDDGTTEILAGLDKDSDDGGNFALADIITPLNKPKHL